MIAMTFTPPDRPRLYVGVDVSKDSHIAAFISQSLLSKHGEKLTACPTFTFKNSSLDFQRLVLEIQRYAPMQDCAVLLEHTGHYHTALKRYLLNCGVQVYVIHVYHRSVQRDKNDKRDAQELAAMLYNQVGLGAHLAESVHLRRATPISKTAAQLISLVQHRYELGQRGTRCKNRLTAICDELFPEFTQAIHNPWCNTALDIRERYPTPADIAGASLREIKASLNSVRIGFAVLTNLQKLAKETVGLADITQVSVVFTQAQLIDELRLVLKHIEEIDERIKKIILDSREGQILTSIPAISPLMASRIIASIGSIGDFDSASKLRAYFGWAPRQSQTGKSFDRMTLTHGGNRLMKQSMYLIAAMALKEDTEWKALFDRLVPLKCQWDARKGAYKGKNKVLGRVAGQMISVIFRLLRDDYDLQRRLMPGEELPPPVLYDRDKHRAHKTRKV